MKWLRNTWYAVAWSDDIAGKPFGRILLDEPVVFFRPAIGSLAAIGGRCPHRFAPLEMGQVVGNAIECPYHGLKFSGNGQCIHNPHGNKKIPNAAFTKQYLVEEPLGARLDMDG